MKTFTCPQCSEATITSKQKYLAGHWRIIHCDQCHARLCGHPVFMALAYALYFWVVAWFAFMTYFQGHPGSLIYLIPAWLFLDYLNINLMPLSVMKSRANKA